MPESRLLSIARALISGPVRGVPTVAGKRDFLAREKYTNTSPDPRIGGLRDQAVVQEARQFGAFLNHYRKSPQHTQSIRTGLCVGQAGREPENLRSFRDRGPALQSEHFASRRDLCGAVPGPATVFLWTASRRSYSKRRNRLGRAGCQRSIHSSWPIAKRRIRTLASVTQRHRKRLSHQGSRARSRGLRRSSAMRRHRKQSSPPRAQPTLPRVPRKRRQNETDIGL